MLERRGDQTGCWKEKRGDRVIAIENSRSRNKLRRLSSCKREEEIDKRIREEEVE